MKLNLGTTIELPLKHDEKTLEYINKMKLIQKLSKNFYSVQIMFSKPILKSKELKQIKTLVKNYKFIYVHANYKINIGSDLIPLNTELYNVGIEILLNEITYATKINANGIVVHMGKNVSKLYEHTHIYNNMIKFIVELFKRIKLKKITLEILLETPAGQGGEMCWNLEDFINFITKFKTTTFYTQLNVCIDTCHIFQAGYDLNNSKIIKNIHKILSPIKNKIKLIHLNDSYNSVGKRIDKHEQIGKGHIQINKLIEFIYPYKSIPMILENSGPYEKQIQDLSNNL